MADIEKEVKSFNGTVVGNPTLDLDTGVVSGFSNNNYLQLPTAFNPGSDTWEWIIKAQTTDDFSGDWCVCGATSDQIGVRININENRKFQFLIGNGTWLNTAQSSYYTGSYTVQANTTYWLKCGWTGAEYYFEYSLDGISYTRDITAPISTALSSVLSVFGTSLASGVWVSWKGSIDLTETYININGVRWWTPIKTGTYYGSTFKVHQTLPYMFGARGVGYYDSVVSKVPTANEDILLTMKTYDGLTETYTEGIGTAGKVDFTGTILPWKWDYNSGLDVSKYCLMPSGLTYENIDIGYKEPNLLYTDTATVSSDNVISNITRGLYTSQRFTFEKEKSFEIFCKVKTGSNVSNIREICVAIEPTPHIFMRIGGSKWNPVLFVNGSVVQGNVGSVATNTVYYVRLKYFPITQVIDGVTYSAHQAYFETSTDNATWTRQHTFDLSTYFIGSTSTATSYTSILDFGAQNVNQELWNGEIYLADCYVKIDGVEVWNGLKPKYVSLPGCTYNFTDDGSAATLNAFAVQGDKSIVLTPDVEYYGNRYLGTVEIPQHDVYQYNNGTWQNAPHLIGGNTYYFKMIGGGGGSSTWDGGAGAYWEGYYTPAQTVAVTLSQGGGGSGAGAYSRRHNGVKGGTTSIVGEGVSIVCEGGQGAIGLRNGDETGNSSTYTYAPTITITNGTYETIKASTHSRPRRISWDDDTVTGYGAGGQAASGTKAPGNDGLAGYLEYYQVGTITINPTPADALVEMSLDGVEYTTTNSLTAKVDETVYYRVSKEGYITQDTSVLVAGNETINVELMEEPQP